MFLVPSIPVISGLSVNLSDYPEGIVIPVDKPYRWTSADVIRKLKFAAIKHFGKKNLKVGHAGTLDPLATGVLLVCIGDACKRAQELQDHDKEYIARVRFGATTPSYDLEKEVDRTFPFEHITREAVEAVLPSFLGEQEQIAPLFSAKSIDGVRAYELARKLYKARASAGSGTTVNPGSSLAPAFSEVSGNPVIPGTGEESPFDAAALSTLHTSRIVINELELLDFTAPCHSEPPLSHSEPSLSHSEPSLSHSEPPLCHSERSEESLSSASSRINVADTSALGLPEAVIRISCSKGTYIRAFARDLGESLGSGAHLGGLIRSRSGAFSITSALSLDQALALFQKP